MFKIMGYVSASTIWPTAKDHTDLGNISGYVRGYNIEVIRESDGIRDWMSCAYIHGDPEDYFDSESYSEWLFDLGLTPTGRICFRGYGREYYDPDERETFIEPISEDLLGV